MIKPEPVTYLDLVRALASLTLEDCDPGRCSESMHRRDAAQHLNVLLSNPRLIDQLARVYHRLNPL